jgi:large subunit ribosomal protein L21
MYAIIKTGGKQYKVKEGDIIDVELLGKEDGSKVDFDVLLVYDGKKTAIGEPTLADYSVKGELVGASAGPKVEAMKYKRRKGYRLRFGHRQHYSRVKITDISGKKKSKKKEEE